MRRKSEYDQTKLTQAATNKTVVSAYADAFPIEQVKFRFAKFEQADNFIDIYLSFEDTLRVCQDIKSGKLFKDMLNSQYPIQISFGGSVKEGVVESRSVTFGLKDNKVYLNAQKGPGKTSTTGAIIPVGKPTNAISVGVNVDDFKGMFLYIEACIHAYLPSLVTHLVDIAEENRKKFTK